MQSSRTDSWDIPQIVHERGRFVTALALVRTQIDSRHCRANHQGPILLMKNSTIQLRLPLQQVVKLLGDRKSSLV